MILRFELREVRDFLVAYLEQRPFSAPTAAPQVPAAEPAADPAPQGEPETAPDPPAATETAPELEAAPPAPTREEQPAPSREKTEQAVAALCQEARGEGIIYMGLQAHLDPFFIVQTYAEALGCSDRDARAAFQAYVKQHPAGGTAP